MKKILLFCTCLLPVALSAQVSIPYGHGRVKLSDVVANYQAMHPEHLQNKSTIKMLLPGLTMERNEKDYQFERWLWYWHQHTDADGYLVSPAKTWQEWQMAKDQEKAHKAERTTSGAGASWTFEGPDSSAPAPGGVGRINVVAYHPSDVNTFWVGTPGGGAWKTTNNGTTWTAMTDQLPLLSVSDIIFNPLNPNTVYLCTGDRDAGDHMGIGVLKSYDGGATWHTTGMTWTTSLYNIANNMVVNPQDTNSLVLATTAGMYRSFDGGATFNLVQAGNFYQVMYRPGDTGTVYATNYIDYYTTPYTYAQVWRSADGGTTWATQTSFTTTDRIAIAVTPAAPNIVMAIGSTAYGLTNAEGLEGVYKSSDAGLSFTQIYAGGCTGNLLTWDATGSGCGGQGWYSLPLAISPVDSNKVYTGGVQTWGSADGGHTWALANGEDVSIPDNAYVHVDKHYLGFNPLLPTRLFETNDGSVFYADDPTVTGTWTNITNKMGIQEIYRTGVSDIAHFEIVGAQDNGSNIILPGDVNNFAYGGDGMQCLLDFADSTVAYASAEQGYIGILDPTSPFPASGAVDIAGNIPGGVEGTGAWITPFVLEPSCHTCIIAGFNAVYQSMDQGNSWSQISPALTTNTLVRIATTTADAGTIFAVENYYDQNLYYTHDGGGTWTTLTAPYTGYQYISDVKVDPRDKDHIWVSFSGYGSQKVVQWSATSGWSLFNAGLPNVPMNCLAIDYISRDMYVGTDIGVYYRDSTMTSWQPYTTGMPSVEVTDIQINYGTNQLWAATFGRSLWKSPKHTTTVPLAATAVVPYAPDVMTLSPNPSNGNFNVSVKNVTNKQVTMRVIDDNGNTVWQGTGAMNNNGLSVSITGLTTGTYIFEITSGNTVAGRQKMIIY